jgi:hypothetical protein
MVMLGSLSHADFSSNRWTELVPAFKIGVIGAICGWVFRIEGERGKEQWIFNSMVGARSSPVQLWE